MNSKPKQTQPQNPTATSLAPARCGASRAGGGQEAAESLASGAPPSNTAPDNCNDGYFKALRWGVDSLYLSYPGELSREADASSRPSSNSLNPTNPAKSAKAQLALGSHIFEVKEKGASLFPYILEDGAFRIQLSRPGHKAPMAYVKVSAKYLAHVGPVEAEKHLYDLLSELGEIKESANVSRIDLFVDFQSLGRYGKLGSSCLGDAGILDQCLCRVRSTSPAGRLAWVGSCRPGFTTSSWRSSSAARNGLFPCGRKAGWDGKGKVWRLEFEIKREVLTQKGLSKLYQVLESSQRAMELCHHRMAAPDAAQRRR